LRGREIIVEKCRVHGAIEGKVVYLLNSSEVFGYIRADKVYMEDGCSVEGGIVGREGVWIREKVEIPGRGEEEEGEETKEMAEEVEMEIQDKGEKEVKEGQKSEMQSKAGEVVEVVEKPEQVEYEQVEENGLGEEEVSNDVS